MDALVAAAIEAASGALPRIVVVPTAAARQGLGTAVANGERAFLAAATRLGVVVEVGAALVVDALSAADPAGVARLEAAHLVHLPGGDPDLLPTVLPGSPAWAAILRAHAAGACVAGASAGAMALAARLWTRRGLMDGLGLVPGVAVLPHFDTARLATWRRVVDPDGDLAWLGLDERTLAIGRPGGPWRVAGAGQARVILRSGVMLSAGDAGVLELA
jgi:cyanophycinase